MKGRGGEERAARAKAGVAVAEGQSVEEVVAVEKDGNRDLDAWGRVRERLNGACQWGEWKDSVDRDSSRTADVWGSVAAVEKSLHAA